MAILLPEPDKPLTITSFIFIIGDYYLYYALSIAQESIIRRR